MSGPNLKKFCAAIARERKKAGLTQVQVAAHLGLEPETISRLEKAYTPPSVSRILQLRDLFGCTFSAFFEEEDPTIETDLVKLSRIFHHLPEAKCRHGLSLLASLADIYR